jgi:hypothetical protein
MFPNVRLMAVTVLAAILGISCGLGLFATFRVNHEPLARLSDGGVSLQLALEKAAPVPKLSPLVVGYPPKPIVVPLLSTQPASADAAAVQPTSAAVAMATVAIPGGGQTAAGEAAVPVAPKVQPQPDVPVATPAEPSIAAAPAGEAAVPDAAPAEPSIGAAPTAEVSQGAPAAQTVGEEEIAKPAQNEKTAALATETPADKAAPANLTDERHKAAAKEIKKRQVKTIRPAPPPRRAAKVVRRRTQTNLAYQTTDQPSQPVSQPAYQWTDTASQTPQTVRRIVIKPRRVISKKTAPQQSGAQSSRARQRPVAVGAQ